MGSMVFFNYFFGIECLVVGWKIIECIFVGILVRRGCDVLIIVFGGWLLVDCILGCYIGFIDLCGC